MASKATSDIYTDIDVVTTWLDKRNSEIRNGQTDVYENDMPVLARVICGGENEITRLTPENRKKYEKFFKDNKKCVVGLTLAGSGVVGTSIGAVASGIGAATAIASLGTGASTVAFASTAVSGLSLAGIGATAFIPVLWPVGISMLAIGAGSIFKRVKDKKEKADRAEKLERIFNESHENAQKCSEKIKANNKKIQLIISQKLKKSIETLANTSKKVATHIDDALNTDQNLRIMQYQEIILNQYNSHNEIRKMLAELVEAYNKLVAENEELSQKVAAYEANMKMCGCTNNYMT